jgi:16S rRNA (guanine527-N7)-methyltransferase
MTPEERGGLLAELAAARELGFFGPGPVEQQLEHSLAFARFLPDSPGLDVLDLGSGGGLPALVLALERPGSRWTLVDGMVRRTTFLEAAVVRLGLADRVDVVTSRAEVLPAAWRERFHAVTARSFGPPAVLAECAAPWLQRAGVLIVSEPPSGTPARWPVEGLAIVGLVLEELAPGPPAMACLRQTSSCPSGYPRRVGLPVKRPIW